MKRIEAIKSKVAAMGILAMVLSMVLALTAFATETTQLGETEKAWWSATTVARWKKVEKATKYQVRLYENGQSVTRKEVTTTSVDFAEYINDGSDYYFEVRALAKNSTQRSGEWVESDMQTVTNWGDTSGRWRTYQQGKKYQKKDNNYVTGGWYMIGGDWYYFNTDGYMKTGWQQVGDQWYYLGEDGVMLTGWKQIGGIWYYLNGNGSMAVGWTQTEPGKWYYFYVDGSMAANTIIDGYQLNESGLCQ